MPGDPSRALPQELQYVLGTPHELHVSEQLWMLALAHPPTFVVAP